MRFSKTVYILFTYAFLAYQQPMQAQEKYRSAYTEIENANWHEIMSDSGQDDWTEHWFVDGHKATLKNTPDGMFYAAGPIEGDHASHSVLWSRESFQGDLKLEFEFTRLDTVSRFVCIVYLYATGFGPEPYVEDISEWNEHRQIPYMSTYFDHMNLLHISYAAFDNKIETGEDSAYIRARRYPRALFKGRFDGMELDPDYAAVGLFKPGIPHHVTVIKHGETMYMNVSNSEEERLYHWDLTQVPNLDTGRIGLRHMWQRAGLYKNIKVSQLKGTELP
ncbi:DUF1961 family protein [Coraliomargarita sp. SDUM461004]|uniref:DUF1961 family protein n=1 Tax=Thalassobacterium sedimentorum TaxID=3041258 RepID=A0ABU1AIL1_9BACT|nr:DUF1961 family protein [Coraliomargarita sp. SDUM461004]MDQ8193611.1 DUF1961 family protein [Coraliomargarita sp. SDUM461004]